MEETVYLREHNMLILKGKIISPFKLNHTTRGENFYKFIIETCRKSGKEDRIPVIILERFGLSGKKTIGDTICIKGQLRTFNNGRKLEIFAFASAVIEESETEEDRNFVSLVGYICKKPIYRTTPFKSEITDVILAVNRQYNKSNYIPCIAWEENARLAANLSIGTKVYVRGRLQSREYCKKDEHGIEEVREAYEVSVKLIEETT